LPRCGLATEGQLEYLNTLYPNGGQRAIQALVNLMDSGVVDTVIWQRESWVGDSIGSVTGFDDDKLDLMDPVAMPPTGGCNLMYTEGVLEATLNQLHMSVEKAMNAGASSTLGLDAMAADMPRQVCMLVQRIRFTTEVQRCVRENRQLSTVTRANAAIKLTLAERLLNQDLPEGQRATLMALQQVLHEQCQVINLLMKTKSNEELTALWNEQMRFYHDEKDNNIELKFGDKATGEKVIPMGNEYSPPTMLITTEFTHSLRLSYLDVMGEMGSKVLVLVGGSGTGKNGMLRNIGQLLGTLPTTIRLSENTPSAENWWRRRLVAAFTTSGGKLAPIILTQAHRAPEAAITVAKDIALEIGAALCLTMLPCPQQQKLCNGVLSFAQEIKIPEITKDNQEDYLNNTLKVIAAGQLAAEGLKESDALAGPLSMILETLRRECTQQKHYDFGPRTLIQLCTQIGVERKKGAEEKDTLAVVMERCLLPKLVKQDVAILKRLLLEHFKIDRMLVAPTDSAEGRWNKVAENIRTITKIEPDCMVLPVPQEDEEAFYEEFCKMLNRQTAALVKFPGQLSDYSRQELMGTMPRTIKDGSFEEVKDGVLVDVLRKAMDEHVDPNQLVWIAMKTGNISPDTWECLFELLNDSHCLNLATGEQLRLGHNLRFLFVMPNAGNTSQDTFSRAAVVWSDPPC